MTDKTLVEGGFTFHFVDVEFAEKYDNWKHYRNKYNSACGSSKAVDFLVLKNDQIWLIEVKDFRAHTRTKQIDLCDEICLKVRDTMAGIVSANFLAQDQEEKNASRKALTRKKLRVALFLEQPEKPTKLHPKSVDLANLKMKLRQSLKFADPHPILTNKADFPEVLGRVTKA